MQMETTLSREALALERVIGAAREVYEASTELKTHFSGPGARQSAAPDFARFAAAMQELKVAREAFDPWVSGNAAPRCWLTAPP